MIPVKQTRREVKYQSLIDSTLESIFFCSIGVSTSGYIYVFYSFVGILLVNEVIFVNYRVVVAVVFILISKYCFDYS